jgi:hypothetical protein
MPTWWFIQHHTAGGTVKFYTDEANAKGVIRAVARAYGGSLADMTVWVRVGKDWKRFYGASF